MSMTKFDIDVVRGRLARDDVNSLAPPTPLRRARVGCLHSSCKVRYPIKRDSARRGTARRARGSQPSNLAQILAELRRLCSAAEILQLLGRLERLERGFTVKNAVSTRPNFVAFTLPTKAYDSTKIL